MHNYNLFFYWYPKLANGLGKEKYLLNSLYEKLKKKKKKIFIKKNIKKKKKKKKKVSLKQM